ncbi:cupin [Mycobacterium stomatepiae]|uniref:Cupin n=1 Tax=Mycobacterium stomatepiae TaxID=470076 RepID=A0A7I7Q2Q9_9MYCO|nr:cupin [Mycobacterium stomatepiae]MCV7166643.1 cupin [Mycobacterium stomatepiae]BBY20297.1 cupin [Mycobacterium stomatepiae]
MRARRGLVSLLLLLAIALPPARGAATPGSGVNSAQETESSQEGRDFIVRDITVDPGGSTGWHWHDGVLVGAIKQGTLTHYAANCSIDGVYNPGDPVIEPAGPDHVHLGRNLGSTPLILEVIYIQPMGKPAAEDAPNPGCPFA